MCWPVTLLGYIRLTDDHFWEASKYLAQRRSVAQPPAHQSLADTHGRINEIDIEPKDQKTNANQQLFIPEAWTHLITRTCVVFSFTWNRYIYISWQCWDCGTDWLLYLTVEPIGCSTGITPYESYFHWDLTYKNRPGSWSDVICKKKILIMNLIFISKMYKSVS